MLSFVHAGMILLCAWDRKHEAKQIGERLGHLFQGQKVNGEVVSVGMTVV